MENRKKKRQENLKQKSKRRGKTSEKQEERGDTWREATISSFCDVTVEFWRQTDWDFFSWLRSVLERYSSSLLFQFCSFFCQFASVSGVFLIVPTVNMQASELTESRIQNSQFLIPPPNFAMVSKSFSASCFWCCLCHVSRSLFLLRLIMAFIEVVFQKRKTFLFSNVLVSRLFSISV